MSQNQPHVSRMLQVEKWCGKYKYGDGYERRERNDDTNLF